MKKNERQNRRYSWGALILLLFLGSGCETVRKTGDILFPTVSITELIDVTVPPDLPEGMPKPFHKALRSLEEGRYEEALQTLDGFIRDEPTSSYTQAAQLNAGRALEGLERWSEAIERYRGVVVACEGIAPKLQAVTLYRLSFSHEARGDDQQAVAVLTDLEKRKAHLPLEIARAELPARLASAYARAGNFEKALDYYKIAERGITQMKGVVLYEEEVIPDWLPRTLYFMGTLASRGVSWEDFESTVRPFAYGQIYLLEAAEFGKDPWSTRASQDLMAAYRDMWRAIETAEIEGAADPVLARRELQRRQWSRGALVLELLGELRARKAPPVLEGKVPASAQVKDIMSFSSDLEGKVKAMLSERPAGEGLTQESARRRSSIRGHVIAPDETLERKFLKGAKEIHARPQDPNL